MSLGEEDLHLVARLRATGISSCERVAEIILLIDEEPSVALDLLRDVKNHLGETTGAPPTLDNLLELARGIARALLSEATEGDG